MRINLNIASILLHLHSIMISSLMNLGADVPGHPQTVLLLGTFVSANPWQQTHMNSLRLGNCKMLHDVDSLLPLPFPNRAT